ncbi:MAG: hypothetical protein AAF557_23535 [Pseudomonadota bacterium]
MERAGLTDVRPNGASYDPTGTVSAKVQTRPQTGGVSVERCSIVFEDPDAEAARSRLMQMLDDSGLTSRPARQGAIGSRIVDIWDLQIDGRPGRVIFLPVQSERLLGGIYLDIPSRNASV